MDAEKRKIIVKEIEHWRRSKLLPEQYCDFLMNLYVDEETEKSKSFMGVSASSVANSNWKVWTIVMAIIAAAVLSILNFNAFGLPMQIGVSTVFVAICYVFGYRQYRKEPLAGYLLFGLASMGMLFLGLYILNLYESESYAYVGYVVLCSVVWLINGFRAKMGVFQFCGWMGLVAVYGWLLLRKLDHPGWLSLEISWIPVSIVLIWIAWLAHHTNKQAAVVLLLVGVLLWFAPEAFTFLIDEGVSSRVVQLSFTGKLISAGVVLFVLRKKWVEWIV